jgi:hypothetical protein
VRGQELRGREMFVPLVHPPGEAQAEFGEALVVIAGVQQKAHFLAMDCPHSDDGFVAAFPGETTEAFQQGHVLAFEYFGAVPTRILYDNTKIAVARVLGGEKRTKTRAFLELQSHYRFADKFGRPGKRSGFILHLVGHPGRKLRVLAAIPESLAGMRVGQPGWGCGFEQQESAVVSAYGPHYAFAGEALGGARVHFHLSSDLGLSIWHACCNPDHQQTSSSQDVGKHKGPGI